MVIGEFDTRSFTFTVIGTSRKDCVRLLKKSWKTHCKQWGMDEDNHYLDQFTDLESDMRFFENIAIGEVYRDGELLYKDKTK